jgi:SOS response regulatory protein OraA/RecX
MSESTLDVLERVSLLEKELEKIVKKINDHHEANLKMIDSIDIKIQGLNDYHTKWLKAVSKILNWLVNIGPSEIKEEILSLIHNYKIEEAPTDQRLAYNIVNEQFLKEGKESARIMQENQRRKIDAYKKQGLIYTVPRIDKDSFFVYNVVNNDGTVVEYSEMEVQFHSLTPEYQEKFLNQEVGFFISQGEDLKLVVLEIYKFDVDALQRIGKANTVDHNLPN